MSRRFLFRAVLGLSTYLAVAGAAQMFQAFTADGWERRAFYDFRLWRAGIDRYVDTGVLYDTSTTGYLLAGSHSLYKYPPPYAGLILPFQGQSQSYVGRAFLFAHIGLLILAFGALAVALRLRGMRLWFAALVFISWRPTWETLSDLQMETLILFLLSMATLCLRTRNIIT